MNEASVGFHCPECLRTGQRAVRQARTAFGGGVHADTALVTKVLIGINVVVFLVQLVVSGFQEQFWMLGQALTDSGVSGVAQGEYYRLLTAAFLHGGVLHIAFNMYALFLFGPMIEGAFGRLRFVALYLGSALAGSAVSYMFSAPNVPSVGASGAIFGLLGAALVVSKRTRRDASVITVLIVLNLAIGFLIPTIDWRAHVGGLVGGVLIALGFAYAPQRLRVPIGVAAVAIEVALAVALVVVRTGQLAG
jgi:membrane associated rhomboid family serine protease